MSDYAEPSGSDFLDQIEDMARQHCFTEKEVKRYQLKPNAGKDWTSCAQWPKGSIVQRRSNDQTFDFHLTEAAARAVCRMLERDGLGGEGKIFPLRTWVEHTSNKEVSVER